MNQQTKNPIDMLVSGSHIVTMDDQWTVVEDGSVAIHDGLILDVNKTEALLEKYQPNQRLGAPGRVVMPGLVNAHTHAAAVLFRGFGDDNTLEEWLEHYLWPAEAAFLNTENMYTGTLLAITEMIRSGTTAFMDMYVAEEAVASAAIRCGMRVVLGEVLFDDGGPLKVRFAESLETTRNLLNEYAQDPLVSVAVQPHTSLTVSIDNLVKAKALADEFGAQFALHACETMTEVANVKAKTGLAPPRLLHKHGLLGENVVFFHAVHLDDEEINLLAESDTGVVHCPDSNLKLGSGIARLPEMLRAGLTVGLGTDGAASNNDLNLWDEVQLATKLHRGNTQDPTVVSGRQAIFLATRGGAKILGLEERIGSIQPGKQADLILLDFDQPHLQPLYDVYSHLAFAVGRGDVRTTIVNGVPLMVEGQIQTFDEEALLAQVRELGGSINRWLIDQTRRYP
jgi:5-methylthioadenosine/S-adenosylhomocysteine deaminase